ncbi:MULTISPECIES: FecR domain-containing protein [unclassified Thalassospira]|uniref:FecR family protein n=1 Tax=unclassified Thalassospira TaxID=2648997 RepID=UPI001B15120C|nr:FecR domain-containing protein [Thalassospira sp.]MBO6773265.1 FecR domain-containing protein [Thalassospira sp.]
MTLGAQSDLQQLPESMIREAARWAARMQSADATTDDQKRFEGWLERDSRHPVAYAEFDQLWSDLRDVPLGDDTLRQIARKRTIRRVSIAIVGLLGLGLTGAQKLGAIDRMQADYYTPTGKTAQITLSDGSVVALNSDTAIRVSYRDDAREIELLRGEAFFEVTPDPGRPFIVKDDGLSARALGTRYGVHTDPDSHQPDVQVEEGTVEVRNGNDIATLQAGEAAKVTAQGTLAIHKVDTGRETAWRDGKLVFSNQPLRQVLETLDQYQVGSIVLISQRAGEQKVSGIFDLNDPDKALRSLEARLPIKITRATGLLTIVDEN